MVFALGLAFDFMAFALFFLAFAGFRFRSGGLDDLAGLAAVFETVLAAFFALGDGPRRGLDRFCARDACVVVLVNARPAAAVFSRTSNDGGGCRAADFAVELPPRPRPLALPAQFR